MLKRNFLLFAIIDIWRLMNRVSNKVRPALRVAPCWRLHSLKKYTISRYIANNSVFTIQTPSYRNTSPILKFILQTNTDLNVDVHVLCVYVRVLSPVSVCLVRSARFLLSNN